MSCVYTGATLLIEEYQLVVRTDLHIVSGAVACRWSGTQEDARDPARRMGVTHVVGGPEYLLWWWADHGALVAPMGLVRITEMATHVAERGWPSWDVARLTVSMVRALT